MKKIIAILTAMALSSSVFALTLGVTADMGFNTMLSNVSTTTTVFGNSSTETSSDQSAVKLNGKVGAIIGIDLFDFIALEPEILFHFGNGTEEVVDETKNGKATVKVSYNTLEIPVLAKLKFKVGPGKLAVAAGPAFTIPFGSVETVIDAAGTVYKTSQAISDAGLNSFIFGAVAGLEYGLKLGPLGVNFGVRYNIDITPAEDGKVTTGSFINSSVEATKDIRRSNFDITAAAVLHL